MKKAFQLSFIVTALLAFMLCPPVKAQTTFTGSWRAETKSDKPDRIHLSFERRTENSRNQNGSGYDYSELQGLTREQAVGGSGAVKFSLVREAGTIECEGNFENGRGTGIFRFTASQNFISAMKARGFDFTENKNNREGEVEDRLFTAAMLDITTALADDLKSGNFSNLTVGDLFKAKIFKVDSQFMRDMKATGFPNLDMGDLVKARIFKVDPEYVREFSNAGLQNESFEVLVRAKMFKVTPEFIRQVRASGLKDQSIDTLVRMSMFNVTPDFIKEIESAGLSGLSTDEIVKLRMFNVTGSYIKELKDEGLTDLSVEQLRKMKMFNINGEFIRKAKSENVPLNVEDLVRRRFNVKVPVNIQ